MTRPIIDPPLRNSFDDVFRLIHCQSGGKTPCLFTTGCVPFEAEAKCSRDGRNFISLPHNNRIYQSDWGHVTNSMGKDGQRIGHYSVPLDKWATVAVNSGE